MIFFFFFFKEILQSRASWVAHLVEWATHMPKGCRVLGLSPPITISHMQLPSLFSCFHVILLCPNEEQLTMSCLVSFVCQFFFINWNDVSHTHS